MCSFFIITSNTDTCLRFFCPPGISHQYDVYHDCTLRTLCLRGDCLCDIRARVCTHHHVTISRTTLWWASTAQSIVLHNHFGARIKLTISQNDVAVIYVARLRLRADDSRVKRVIRNRNAQRVVKCLPCSACGDDLDAGFMVSEAVVDWATDSARTKRSKSDAMRLRADVIFERCIFSHRSYGRYTRHPCIAVSLGHRHIVTS